MTSCPFCEHEQTAKQLVAEIAGNRVIATLGQITDGGYVLVVPKRHVECVGALTAQEVAGFKLATDRVTSAVRREFGGPVTIFEHGVVGQTVPHAHLHVMPEEPELESWIYRDFPRADYEDFDDFAELGAAYAAAPRPYLLWAVQGDILRVCWNPPAPPLYLRLAAAESLGRPERGDWRNVDPVADRKLITETVERLSPRLIVR